MKRTLEYGAAVIAVAANVSTLGFGIGTVNVMDPLHT
jgi:hypothetical protein